MTCIKKIVLNYERTDQIQCDMVVCYSQREDSGNILLLLVCMSIMVIVITVIDILTKDTIFPPPSRTTISMCLIETVTFYSADTAFYD